MYSIATVKEIFLDLKKNLRRFGTKLYFYLIIYSERVRNYYFEKNFKKYNPNFNKINRNKKTLVLIWEGRLVYLKDQIQKDNRVNLIIIPRLFFNPGWLVFLRNYHIAKSKTSLGEYSLDFYRSDIYEKDRIKFRQYCNLVHKFISKFIKIDMILVPKCNDDWSIDYIKVINESNIKLIIDDRESAITNQRLLKVPPKLKGIGLEFDIMTTHNKIHKDLFVKAGFPQSKICVNGAPQSDYWFKKTYWQKLSKLNSDLREDRIKILFFSFGERTYMNFYYGDEQRTWMPFIKEVNDVLIAILEKYHNRIQIIYKFGGKVKRDTSDDTGRFKNAVKKYVKNGSLIFMNNSISSYDLIRNSQLTVGFQTSGIIEAMNINKPIFYIAWGKLYDDIKKTLLPLEDENCLTVCSSKDSFFKNLAEFIESFENSTLNNQQINEQRKSRNDLIDKYFANSDGLVCKRLANIIYNNI